MSSDGWDETRAILNKVIEERRWEPEDPLEAYFERRWQAERQEREYQRWKEKKEKEEGWWDNCVLFFVIMVLAIGMCFLALAVSL